MRPTTIHHQRTFGWFITALGSRAENAILALVRRSAAFRAEPLPDGYWRVYFDAEHKNVVAEYDDTTGFEASKEAL